MEMVFSHFPPLEIILKLLGAAALSLVIGFERELKKKPVGLKTSLVIATFSCLLTIISIETAYSTPPRPEINITMDPLRLAAQIVSGIGFLGAGVILRKGNDSITGLTTAAMIWGAAGIGIAVGAGFYWQAVLVVLIVVLGIEFLTPLLLRIGPSRLRQREVLLYVCVNDSERIANLTNYLTDHNMHIEHMHVSGAKKDKHDLHLRLLLDMKYDTITLYDALRKLPYVTTVSIEFLT